MDAIARDPGIGTASKHASYREYRTHSVRVLYVSTALGTRVIWGSRGVYTGQHRAAP